MAAPSGAGGSAGLGSAYWHLGWQCVALRRERVVPRPLWAPTPPTAFVSTKSRREVANKCTPVALLPGHHRAKLRASSCAIVTVLASREADPTVSAFRGDGASSTNFGAANACKTAPRAAANILRYPTLRGSRATEIAAGRGYRKAADAKGAACSPRRPLRSSHPAALR